jgi:hypothetical protein
MSNNDARLFDDELNTRYDDFAEAHRCNPAVGLIKFPILLLYPFFFLKLSQFLVDTVWAPPKKTPEQIARQAAERQYRIFIVLFLAGVVGLLVSYFTCDANPDVSIGIGIGGFITLIGAIFFSGMKMHEGVKLVLVGIVLLLLVWVGMRPDLLNRWCGCGSGAAVAAAAAERQRSVELEDE